MIRKIFKIIIGHFKFKKVEPWVQERRDICKGCKHRKGFFRKYCGKCLCTIRVKTEFECESCPIGKWKEHDNKR